MTLSFLNLLEDFFLIDGFDNNFDSSSSSFFVAAVVVVKKRADLPHWAPELLGELDPGGRYLVICEGGYRSGQLASWLDLHGFEDVTNVIDGMWAWRRRE